MDTVHSSDCIVMLGHLLMLRRLSGVASRVAITTVPHQQLQQQQQCIGIISEDQARQSNCGQIQSTSRALVGRIAPL